MLRRLHSLIDLRIALIVLVAMAALLLPAGISNGGGDNRAEATHLPAFADGVTGKCQTFDDEIRNILIAIAGPIGLLISAFIDDVPEPGWVWADPAAQADPSKRIRSASGKVVTEDQPAVIDFPFIHDSHDFFFNMDLDPGQDAILSVANNPNAEGGTVAAENDLATPTELHTEWEIGTFADEVGSDPERTFPKWAWPNMGDRVYTNGNWIYDCGHPTTVTDPDPDQMLFRSEIHPPRALASMRPQMRTLPGTGTTPVPVTATDLYIHGHAGFATDDLVCGPDVILDAGSCSPEPYPGRATPIDDNYEWDICLPPLPFDKATVAKFVEDGPDNTVTDPALAPQLDTMPVGDPAVDACAAPEFGPQKVHVTIPLAGSGVTPEDRYTRRIYAGWVFPAEGLRHLKLTLNKMDLHEDFDLDPGDCECTFFHMSVNRAPNEWIRLSTFATGDMNAYDDDDGAGDGEMGFSGAEFDFFVANGQDYSVRAKGYDQDCFEDNQGNHLLASGGVPTVEAVGFGLCALEAVVFGEQNGGDNDGYETLSQSFGPADYVGAKDVSNPGNQFELLFNVEDVPLSDTLADTSDLVLTKDCKPDSPALAGQQFTCTILVQNPGGPGLPGDVVVDDTMLTDVDPSKYTLEDPTFTFGGIGGLTDPCIDATNPIETIPGGKEFHCNIGTVPIGGKAIITMHITSTEGGDFNNHAIVSTSSTDPDLSNNVADDSVHVTPVADLTITKSDSEDPLISGTTLTYTLNVGNDGPSTAVNVLAEDFLPAGVSINSVSGTGGASCLFGIPGDVTRPTTCAFDTMGPGDSETMTIVVTVLAGSHNFLHNDARVSSDVLDLDNSDNVDSENTQVKVADVQITKTSTSDTSKPSQQVTYYLTVHNNGPADAENVVMTDDLPLGKSDRVFWIPGSPPCSKPAGGTLLTCNFGTVPAGTTKSVTVIIVFKGNRGIVSNTANVASSTTFDPNPANNSSTKLVLVGQPPKK